MKQDTQDDMNIFGANIDQMQVFAIINNVGIMKKANANVKN